VAVAFVSLVGQTANGGSSATIAVTVSASGVAAGNTVIILLNANGDGTVNSVSDTRGNAWVIDRNSTSTTGGQVVSSKITTALQSGDTITVTGSASIAGRIAIAAEFSGVGGLQVANSQTGVSTTATGSTTVAVNAGDLAVGMFGEAVVTDDFQNLDANYTEVARQAGSSSRSLLFAYRLNIPAGVNTATCDFPISQTWRAMVAAYLAEASTVQLVRPGKTWTRRFHHRQQQLSAQPAEVIAAAANPPEPIISQYTGFF
jgi:hypothetical protein